MGLGVLFREVKRQGREFDPSSPSRVEAKNEWSYVYTPTVCHRDLDRDRLIFLPFFYVNKLITSGTAETLLSGT
jgi:hypothetical protein